MNVSKITRRSVLKLGGAAAVTAAAGAATRQAFAADPGQTFYVGSYGTGIARGTVNTTTGALTKPTTSTAVVDPSWVAYNAATNTLFAISETNSKIAALDPTKLVVSSQVATGGGPCHVAVHSSGRFLFTADYGGGGIAGHTITNGKIDPAVKYPQGKPSNGHEVVFDPTGKYVLAADLGQGGVFTYALDASGKLSARTFKSMGNGAGSRHLVFHPNGAHVYVANEINGTITVCSWANGVLTPGPSVVAAGPNSTVHNAPGEITISKDGKFVYVSNRGPNTVGVFAVSPDGSKLTFVASPSCGGQNPRNLTLDPAGKWMYVANQDSGTVNWLPVNTTTGIPGASAGSIKVPGAAHILLI